MRPMIPLIRAAAAGLLALATLPAFAGPILWVSTGGAQLATVDVATGTTSVIGNTGVNLTDIAFSPSGDLYGIAFSTLYKIDPATAALTSIGSLGTVPGSANSLVFGADGTLYMASSTLFTVDVLTGATTAVGSGIGSTSGGDLAFIGGELFMASAANELVHIDLATGIGSVVGKLGVSNMYGLATPDNTRLYGVADQSVYSIDIGNGAGSLQSTFSPTLLGGAYGLAFRTEAGGGLVPEPATIALTGLALLGAAAARRRATRD